MQKRITGVKEKIIISVIAVCCTIAGGYILSETIFLTDDVKISRIERKLDEVEKNLESTSKARFNDLYTQLEEKRKAGLITYSQLDDSLRDFNIKESRYVSDLAEEMADQANLSSPSAKSVFLMDRAAKNLEKVARELKSR
jgi:hypothetical protein